MRTSTAAADTAGPAHETAIDDHDAGVVSIPDSHFLFHAEFTRTGSDLTLTGEDGHHLVVPGYFSHEHLPTLMSPEGGSLLGAVVESLTSAQAPLQYAQAGAPVPAPQAIGKIDKVSGSATVVRNGTVVTLNVGDTVLKGDVVQTGADSALVISFVDGTALNLSAGTRMALNDFVYDASTAAGNSGVLSLIQGGFAFVAGQVAHTGGLNINTPVGTMGIRGTAGGASCADSGNCQFFASRNVDGSLSVYQVVPNTAAAGAPPILVQVGTLAQITSNGQATFTPADNLAPGLSNLMNQLLQDYPQIIQNLLQPQPPQPAPGTPNKSGSVGSSDTFAVQVPHDPLPNPGNTPLPPPPLNVQPPPPVFVTIALLPQQPVLPDTPPAQATTVSNAVANQNSAEDTPWHFTLSASPFSDANAPITATLANSDPLPVWLTFNPTTLTFDGTPPHDFNGSIAITLSINGGSLTDSFTLNVTPVNDAPTATPASSTATNSDHFSNFSFDGWAAVSLGNAAMHWFMDGHSAGEISNSGTGFLQAPGSLAPPAATAYTIAVDVDPNLSGFGDSHTNNGVGVVFGYVDGNNYYKAYWADYGTNYTNSDHRDLILSKVVNGVETVLSRVDNIDLGSGEIHFQVVVDGSGITVNVDGSEHNAQLTAAGETPVLHGVGLFTDNNDDGVAYDNFAVTVPALQATEQTALALNNIGLSVGDVDAGSSSMTVTLSVGEGTLTYAAPGNADSNADSGGQLIVTGSGSSSLIITGTLAQINSLLGSTDLGTLSYIDNTDTPAASTALTLTVHDNGNTGSGGDLSATSTTLINITAVDDAPVIDGGATATYSIAENTKAVTTVSATDPDNPSLTYSLVNTFGTDASKFTINASTGALSFISAPNFESPNDVGGPNGDNAYVVVVRASDGTLSDTQTITVNVTNVNEAPALSPNSNTVSYAGGDPLLRLMPTATITDPDNPSNFNGGAIDVLLAGNSTGDELTLATVGRVSLSGSDVVVDHLVVGTLSGNDSGHLHVDFNNSNATDSRVEAVLQAVAYNSDLDIPASGNRTATVTFHDGGNNLPGGDLSDSSTVTIHVTDPPVIHTPAGGIRYWASNTTGDVTPINHISFDDADAGSASVRVTFTMNDFGDKLDANNLTGSGVSVVSGDGTSQIKLQGSIANINAYLFNGNLLWNPDGSADHQGGTLTVSIDDNGAVSGGNVVSTTVNISEISTPGFTNSANTADFSNVNFTNISSVNSSGGNDTITTSWNHQGAATVYDGGSGTDDTIHLVFTPDQLSEIFANQTTRDAWTSYFHDPAGQLLDPQADRTLDLSGTSWNAEVKNFEHADFSIVTDFGSGETSAPVLQPAFVIGTSGDDPNLVGTGGGNHVLIGLAGNDILHGDSGDSGLLGGAGNDILIGGPGNDIMSGSTGSDTFRFTDLSGGHANIGNDVIVDFHPGEDTIEISNSIFADFAALQAATTDDGHGNTVIAAYTNNSITLEGVSKATLVAHQSDVHFTGFTV